MQLFLDSKNLFSILQSDIVKKDKDVFEVKYCDEKLSTGQQKLSHDIEGREVTPVGKNAEAAGLQPGTPTTMTSCTVNRRCN